MISKNHTKTALEKEWLETVVDFAGSSPYLKNTYGSIVEGFNVYEIDHILGAKTKRKINGVSERVGGLAIMPVPKRLHSVFSSHKYNCTTKSAKYRAVFGHEKQVWLSMIRTMQAEGYTIPFSEEIIQAIVS